MTFKATAILTAGYHYLALPPGQCVRTGVLPPPPQPAKPDHVRSLGVVSVPLPLFSHSLSTNSACSSQKFLRSSLHPISVSLVEGTVDMVVGSPMSTHFTSSCVVVLGLPCQHSHTGGGWTACPHPPLLLPVISSPSHSN